MLFFMTLSASAQTVVVYKTDGTKVYYHDYEVKDVTVRPTPTDGIAYYGWVDSGFLHDDNTHEFSESLFTEPITETNSIINVKLKKCFIIATLSSEKPKCYFIAGGNCGLTSGSDWEINNTIIKNGKTYYVWLRETAITDTSSIELSIEIQ